MMTLPWTRSATVLLWLLCLSKVGALGQVVIHEVLADNKKAISNGESYPDYVELHNPSVNTISLGGFGLTDNLSQPFKYVFAAGTELTPGGFQIVWCDSDTNSPGLHAGFALSSKGEVVGLFNPNGVMLDSVVFGLQLPDSSIGRTPDATGSWTLNVPTPASSNVTQPLGDAAALRFNEWMANATPDPDWFEIYSDTNLPVALGGLVFTDQPTTPPTNRALPALSYIAGNGFVQFFADDLAVSSADHLDFKLSSTSGETLRLYAANRATVLATVTFGPQSLNISQGRLPDGGTNIVFFHTNSPTPGESNFQSITNFVVSELLTHTDPPFEDAVEFFNPTTHPVDISNWWLSNDRKNPMRYRIPANTVIPPGSFLVVYEDQFDPNDLGFTFHSYEAGEVVLCSADGAGMLTGNRLLQPFEAAEHEVSFARFPTSLGADFVASSATTFGMDSPTNTTQFRTGTGAANAYPRIGPVIINEIMYHPPDLLSGGTLLDNTEDEYIELFNVASTPTPLYDPDFPTNQWRIRNAISFDFPADVVIPARSYVVIVSFDPTNTLQLDSFQAKYSVPTNVQILGPYHGKLDNRGETIELLKPDPPQPPDRPKPGLVPYILVDHVDYLDRSPWPDSPDGDGNSLQRRSSLVYGNDPLHWFGATPTPGRSNPVERPLIESVAKGAGGGISFQFTALAGVAYDVEWQTSLTSHVPVVLTNIAAATEGRLVRVKDPASPMNEAARFYRIRAKLPP